MPHRLSLPQAVCRGCWWRRGLSQEAAAGRGRRGRWPRAERQGGRWSEDRHSGPTAQPMKSWWRGVNECFSFTVSARAPGRPTHALSSCPGALGASSGQVRQGCPDHFFLTRTAVDISSLSPHAAVQINLRESSAETQHWGPPSDPVSTEGNAGWSRVRARLMNREGKRERIYVRSGRQGPGAARTEAVHSRPRGLRGSCSADGAWPPPGPAAQRMRSPHSRRVRTVRPEPGKARVEREPRPDPASHTRC